MSKKTKVAVIGAGSAGTFSAFEIYKKLRQSTDITVYERAPHAGGRAHEVTFAGTHIEIGGTLLHSSGKHTNELMAFTDAQEGVPGVSVDGDAETYAFWTNKGFPVFTKTSLLSMAFNILKYVGIPSALRVTTSAQSLTKNWESIYDLQRNERMFTTTDELLETTGLQAVTKVSLGQYLKDLKVNGRMAHDVVEAIVHNMYNQGLELNAFAGLVGLAGAGLAGGYLFAIDGGNWSLFEKALQKMAIMYRPDTRVSSIAITTGTASNEGAPALRSFTVTTDDGQSETYDAVVIATPFALSGIEVIQDGEPLPIAHHPYQQVHTTLVVGKLNPAYFGVRDEKDLPSTIFTADSAGAPFQSIGVTGYSPEYDSRIYKIFSAEHPMTSDELSTIFADVDDILDFIWEGAYPVLTPGIEHVPFEIQPGLYYACAFETAAGSIEVEAVGGVNAGKLASRYLAGL